MTFAVATTQRATHAIPAFAGFSGNQGHHKHHIVRHYAMKTESAIRYSTQTSFYTISSQSWIEALRHARQHRKNKIHRELHEKTSALTRR